MIEELKELLNIIGNVPDMALHAFFAFGAYKIIVYLSTTAGIYGVLRLAINSMKEIKLKEASLKEMEINKPKEVIMTGDNFDLYSADFTRLSSALRDLRGDGSRFINSTKMDKVIKSISEISKE